MLLVRCANAWVVWIFAGVDRKTKVAICANDQTKLIYNRSVDASQGLLIRDIITHSIVLGGSFTNLWWIPL